MSTFSEEFGARIAKSRRASELTQTQLGKLLGLTRSSVANIEAGRQGVSAEKAVQISDALKESVHWLMTGHEECAAPPPALVIPGGLRLMASHMRATVGEIDAILETQ